MIAITGIGVISAIGTGKAETLRSLENSACGINRDMPLEGLDCEARHLGWVRDFQPKNFIPAMKARRMSRFSQLALSAAIEAVHDAGISIETTDRDRSGVAVGTGLASTGSTDSFYEGLLREGPEGTNPMIFPETVQNIAAAHIGMHFGITGANITFSHADISSELALAYACDMLKAGRFDRFIVAGADELNVPVVVGYDSLGLLSDEMLPYDIRRRGFVLAEGAAAFVLERIDDATARGAKISAVVSGPAFSSSPLPVMHYDEGLGSMTGAMRSALAMSGVTTPGFIAACANATRDLDLFEARAIRDVFGDDPAVPVSALRSLYGYFSGDGMVRIALSALCLNRGIVPSTLGTKDIDPECGRIPVSMSAREAALESVMVNSFAPGGAAASVVLWRQA